MFNSFKKKKSDKDHLHLEARNLVARANEADQITRVAVGHAINMANSIFIKQFGSPERFRKMPKSEQTAYIRASSDLVERLANHDPLSAVGSRIFTIWIVGLSENDRDLLLIVEATMNKLSGEGNLGELID